MPRLHVPASAIPALGEITLGRRVGVGEVSLDAWIDAREGRWRAYYLDEEAVDRLVDDGTLQEPTESGLATQLLLVHVERDVPTEHEIASLVQAARMPIEGARFTLADEALASALSGDDGFYDVLDGVHGTLRQGTGVTLMLSGDGHAVVWTEASDATGIVLAEMY